MKTAKLVLSAALMWCGSATLWAALPECALNNEGVMVCKPVPDNNWDNFDAAYRALPDGGILELQKGSASWFRDYPNIEKEITIRGAGSDMGDKGSNSWTQAGGPVPQSEIINGALRFETRKDIKDGSQTECSVGCDTHSTVARYRVTQIAFTFIPPQVRFTTLADGHLTNTGTDVQMRTVTSATGQWSAAAGDVGKLIRGTGIPNGTRIESVTNATTVVMTRAATVTRTDVVLTTFLVDFDAGSGGMITLSGNSDSIRIDHNRFNVGQQSVTPGTNEGPRNIRVNDYARPLVDNNWFTGNSQKWYCDHSGWARPNAPGSPPNTLVLGTNGDGSWESPNTFGKQDAFVVEDNHADNGLGAVPGTGGFIDSEFGARYTIRFNDLIGGSINNHGTQALQMDRGTRQVEVYRNAYSGSGGHCIDSRGGSGIAWGNTATTGWKDFYHLNDYRGSNRDEGSRWGPANGFHVTDVNFTNFPGARTDFAGGTASGAVITGVDYGEMTVAGADPGWVTNRWKGYSLLNLNPNSLGNGGLRHASIIESGSNTIKYAGATITPNQISRVMGFQSDDSWKIGRIKHSIDMCGMGHDTDPYSPRTSNNPPLGTYKNTDQVIDGVWNWLNTIGSGSPPSNNAPVRPNNDFLYIRGGVHYFNYGGLQQTQSGAIAPFTGSDSTVDYEGIRNPAGVNGPVNPADGDNTIGVGPLARRPAEGDVTTRVGYWATDQGEWDSTHAGADGRLYTCTPAGVQIGNLPVNMGGGINAGKWIEYYMPLQYPHPLRHVCLATGEIDSPSSATWQSGQTNSHQITVCNFSPAPTNYTRAGDALPTNVSFSNSTGALTSNANPIAAGTYNFTFTATNGAGGENDTQAFTLTVETTTPTNNAPTVTLQTSHPSPLIEGSTISLEAFPGDSDGSIVRVDFLDGSTVIATLGTSPYTTPLTGPYTYDWENVTQGTKTITAKAYDDDGATGTTPTPDLTLTVLPKPDPGGGPEGPSNIKVVP